jgi:hypothetical protein
MDILAAIRHEERKLESQLGKLQHQLNGVRAAAKALGHSASREVKAVKIIIEGCPIIVCGFGGCAHFNYFRLF